MPIASWPARQQNQLKLYIVDH